MKPLLRNYTLAFGVCDRLGADSAQDERRYQRWAITKFVALERRHRQLFRPSRIVIHIMGIVLGGVMLTGLAAAQSTPPQASSFLAAGTFRLTVTERELSLDARETSLVAILAEISHRTGIPIVTLSSGVDVRITIHLSLMPLDKALKQLAPNMAIARAQGPQAPSHRIAKVYVLPNTNPSQLEGRPNLYRHGNQDVKR